jgi:tRNA(Ile)-lysidine synthase
VIPSLSEALARNASAGAARSRFLLEEEADALDGLARLTLPEAFSDSVTLDRVALRSAPRALTRRALSAWLSAHHLIQSMSAPAMDLLMAAVYALKRKNRLSAGAFYIELDEATVRLVSAQVAGQFLVSGSIEAGESLMLSTGALLETEFVELDDALRSTIMTGGVNADLESYVAVAAEEALDVRGWQHGDRFRPLGAPGTKKLKDWFIDRHIPVTERKLLPLVVSQSGEIIWVPGFPPADTMKIGTATKWALRLTYQRRNPI